MHMILNESIEAKVASSLAPGNEVFPLSAG